MFIIIESNSIFDSLLNLFLRSSIRDESKPSNLLFFFHILKTDLPLLRKEKNIGELKLVVSILIKKS